MDRGGAFETTVTASGEDVAASLDGQTLKYVTVEGYATGEQLTNVATDTSYAMNTAIANGEKIEGLQSQVTDVAKQADKAEAKADGALKVQGNGVLYNHGTDLTTGINLNTSAIEQEVKDRESGDAQLQTQIDGVQSQVTDVAKQADKAEAKADGALKVQGNGVLYNHGTDLTTGINLNTSAIEQEVKDRESGDAQLQTQIDGVQSQVTDVAKQADKAEAKADGALKVQGNGVLYNHGTDLTTGINLNTSAIEQEVKDRENADKQLSNAITNNSHRIDSLSGRVDDLGGEIDNVGAISAALAGLHPLDYDGTGSKFQLAAAMGSYDGSQAAAIGGFYHFNEDVMMSVGGATAFDGDNKSAFNVGVSFRIGQGSSGKKVNSDDVLAQLNAMNEKIAALEAENQQLSEKVAALEGGEGAEAAEAE